MLDTAHSIDQALFEASMAMNYTRPAVVRPYIELDKKTLTNIKSLLTKIEKETSGLEKNYNDFAENGEKLRLLLEQNFADNKDKVTPQHLDNLYNFAIKLENQASKNSAEEVLVLKKLKKQFKILARENPIHKEQIQKLFSRIFAVGDKTTEEVYDMALFLRALRAEYDLDKEESEYFEDSQAMSAYLKGLVA